MRFTFDSPRRTFRVCLIAAWFELNFKDVKVPYTITTRVKPSRSDNLAELLTGELYNHLLVAMAVGPLLSWYAVGNSWSSLNPSVGGGSIFGI